MTGTVTFPDAEHDTTERTPKRRSGLRQRLIEAERGISFGFRGTGSLYSHVFCCMVIVLTASILGLSGWEWLALSVSMICGIASELFHLAVKELAQHLNADSGEKATRLSAAGMVMVMIAGSIVVIAILSDRLIRMLT